MSYQKELDEILPYLTLLKDNIYEINTEAIINELRNQKCYKNEYVKHIYATLLSKSKYNQNLSLKMLIFCLGLYKSSKELDGYTSNCYNILIIAKHETLYVVCYLSNVIYSEKQIFIISDILNNNKDLVGLQCTNMIPSEYFKYDFADVIYNVITKKITDIPYIHLNISKNDLCFNNMFKYNILYILYYKLTCMDKLHDCLERFPLELRSIPQYSHLKYISKIISSLLNRTAWEDLKTGSEYFKISNKSNIPPSVYSKLKK